MLNAEFKIGSLRGNRQTGLGYGPLTIDKKTMDCRLWTKNQLYRFALLWTKKTPDSQLKKTMDHRLWTEN